MSNLNHIFIICSTIVIAMSLMPTYHCRTLKPDDLKLIEKTCNNTPIPNLCLQILKADPRSASADIPHLALIFVDVIKVKANEALIKINKLLKGSGDKQVLKSCAGAYHAILVGDVPMATQALQLGNPKFAEDAVADSSLEAMDCEEDFKGKSPLTKENTYMRDVSDVARAVIRNLL
ncbi:hypothetical protein VNO78_12174 [Psophocarpus tetragonolobus]|uniref:Pectinesterase inhibitor domain-containing protein n=1 Tax=Psophocarpus tetragonolobus TaxID=3891 RepID=A0AAN9SQG5_PSOTE